jgi:hypothetical protein
MTTSSNDGEALSAMRKANAQLTKFNLTWPEFVKARITVAADPFALQPTQSANGSKAPPPASPSMQSQYAASQQSTRAPKPTPPRPAPKPTYAPPPPPPPAEYTYAAGAKPNKFSTICANCSRKLAPGDGVLWRVKNISQRWDTRCAPGLGCQATSGRARGARKIDAQTIDDIINGL